MMDKGISVALIDKETCYAPIGEKQAYDRCEEATAGHGQNAGAHHVPNDGNEI